MFNQNFKKSIKESIGLFGDGILFGSGFLATGVILTKRPKNYMDDPQFVVSISMASLGLSLKAVSNII